eukprot:jgi/Picre1/29494/NNA_004880.t1
MLSAPQSSSMEKLLDAHQIAVQSSRLETSGRVTGPLGARRRQVQREQSASAGDSSSGSGASSIDSIPRTSSDPSRVVAPFSVETPSVRVLEEGQQGGFTSVSKRSRKSRTPLKRSANKAKVSFSSSVFDLATGDSAPLHTSEERQADFVRRSLLQGQMESEWKYSAPLGHRILEKWVRGGKGLSLRANRMLVLVLTFLCYMSYHASRKPPSIVKSVLHGTMKDSTNMGDDSNGRRLMAEIIGDALWEENKHGKHSNTSAGAGWAPFDNPRNGNVLLGDLDVAFLGAYAIGMFVSGHLGDRLDLRKFLTWGMIGSGTCVCLFGVAYFADIHAMPYFLSIQLVGGLVQATGWPSVVTVMANWFGHGKRGLIMGVWNAHTSVGNILGSLMAASMLQYGWGWSFIVPGLLIIVAGILIFSFLVVEPQDIGFMPQSGSHLGSFAASEAGTPRGDDNQLSASDKELLERRLAHIAETHDGMVPSQVAASMEAHHHIRRPQHGMVAMGSTLVMVNDDRDSIDGESDDEQAALIRDSAAPSERGKSGVSFFAAWRLPGVAVYAFTLFFAKLVAYTFLYWLPYYISSTKVGGRSLSAEEAGKLSILFDVGGVIGGIVAGFLSDASASPAIRIWKYFFLCEYFADDAGWILFVNGPYALITTAVSADLGSSESVKKKGEKALATVTAIIDGMGSIGAALGPMATGYISELKGGFDNVFAMLYGSALAAGLLLSSLVVREVTALLQKRRKSAPDSRLRSDDVLNSSSFSYLPPGGSEQMNIIIDNETGVKYAKS